MPATHGSTGCRSVASCALLSLLLALPLFSALLAQRAPDHSLLGRTDAAVPGDPDGLPGAAVRAGERASRGHAGAVLAERRRGAEPSTVVEALLAPTPASPAAEEGLDLPDFLPGPLRRDLHDLHRRVQRARTVLFGRQGIVRLGRVEGSDLGRLRLNLQYDPHPGVRFVLVLR